MDTNRTITHCRYYGTCKQANDWCRYKDAYTHCYIRRIREKERLHHELRKIIEEVSLIDDEGGIGSPNLRNQETGKNTTTRRING